MAWLSALGRFARSLYARIALVYLASLLLLSLATAWVAVSQFDRLGREWQQRTQIDLAKHLAQVMQPALRRGAQTPAAARAARLILSINPLLSLYVLDARGVVIGDYAKRACGMGAQVSPKSLHELLGKMPMLPVFAPAPCSGRPTVFSTAPIHYGPDRRPGYLFAVLGDRTRMSMPAMLRTSSITHTLMLAWGLALLLAGALGLVLFALLTRRFSRLTRAVQRFARGDYGQRISPVAGDEIGRLGQAFNDMAATIEVQLNALRESDRQRRELVANLSHDFRTPLTSLRGYAEQLRDRVDASTRAAHFDAILANVDRLNRLAQQLSTLARVDGFEKPLRIEPFSLAELAHDIAGKFQPQARQAGVGLTVSCPADLAYVAADLELIDRALSNLIDNALQATPAGGTISVGAAVAGKRVRVFVEDTGVGLSAAEIPLVAQRFYRTEGARERGEGSGLGLSIVADICERHDTRLTIDSAPGQGTRMVFDLALA